MASTEFPIEIHAETDGFTEELQRKTGDRLLRLKGDHTDMVSATISVEEIARGERPFRYQFKAILHMRPDRVVASEKADNVRSAMKGCLSALERQVRERRAKLKEHWKRPDIDDGPPPAG